MLQESNDNVFIIYHRNSDNIVLQAKPKVWESLQLNGEIADGVAVIEGEKILVVAPTEVTLPWSSAEVAGGGFTTGDRMKAVSDQGGKTNTAAQITHPECQGTNYAPGYCAAYSRVNANGKGITAGQWWLPSLGEFLLIYANLNKINYALSLINEAKKIEANSSTLL